MQNKRTDQKPGLLGRVFVQLYKIPWVKKKWAENYQALEFDQIPWTELKKPLSQCKVSFVTTGGLHKKSDEPFNMQDPDGDPQYRAFPNDIKQQSLQITHDYFDHKDADKDINILLPFDSLHKLVKKGRIGSLAKSFYSFMGHIQGHHLETLQQRTAVEIANKLKEEGVDVVVLAPA